MPRKTVAIVYNTCIYVVKFRMPLITALQEAGYEVVVVAPEDESTEVLRSKSIAYRPINMSQYGMNPLKELRSIREIRAIFEEVRPFASLHYTIKPNTFGTMAAHQAGVPVLNNIAGAGRAFSGGNPLMRALVMRLYQRALGGSHTVFFQNGEDMEVFSRARLVRDEQCARIPGSGVDLARFAPTPLPDGPLRFLFVGRLLKEKGITEFLEAANEMLAKGDPGQLRFEVAGEHVPGNRSFIPLTDLERLTDAEQITYHGKVQPERVDGLMREASCVVLPSYYGEGVPRVLLEACASGRPIVTTDNVGCRDVVEAGVNGWKVPPRDVGALAGAMEAFAAATDDERSAMARAARRTAETRFDEKIVIQAYLDRLALLDTGRAGQGQA